MNVKKPIRDAKRFGWKPNGGGHSVVASQVIFRIRNRGSWDFLVETFQGDFQVGWQSSIPLVEYLIEVIYEGGNQRQ